MVDVLREGDREAARVSCSGTHTGIWQGHPPTGRGFTDIADVYFRSEDGLIAQVEG